MVRVTSRHSHFPTKKRKKKELEQKQLSEESANMLIEKRLGFKKTKVPIHHEEGYCKLCHKGVANIEAHVKIRHSKGKMR